MALKRCAECDNPVSEKAVACPRCGAPVARTGDSPHPLATVPLAASPGMPALAPYGLDPASGLPLSDKSKVAAGLLQIFLGAFGVGRFYTGHTGLAIAQIAATWLTCGVGGLWPLIDGIVILASASKDKAGRLLRS